MLTIRGVVARLEWGYFVAAAINGYTVTRDGEEWKARGTVVLADAFNLTRRPLRFVAPTQHGEWVWPVREHTIVDGRLTARLGPPEPYGLVVHQPGNGTRELVSG